MGVGMSLLLLLFKVHALSSFCPPTSIRVGVTGAVHRSVVRPKPGSPAMTPGNSSEIVRVRNVGFGREIYILGAMDRVICCIVTRSKSKNVAIQMIFVQV